jgi:hypothetical protein
MLFKKLFRMLVMGGAVVGAGAGCAARAQSADQRPAARDGGAQSADAGTHPDGGAKAQESGSGVPGW